MKDFASDIKSLSLKIEDINKTAKNILKENKNLQEVIKLIYVQNAKLVKEKELAKHKNDTTV